MRLSPLYGSYALHRLCKQSPHLFVYNLNR